MIEEGNKIVDKFIEFATFKTRYRGNAVGYPQEWSEERCEEFRQAKSQKLEIVLSDDNYEPSELLIKTNSNFENFDLILIIKKGLNIHFENCNFKSLIIKIEEDGFLTGFVVRKCSFKGSAEFDINCNSSITYDENKFFGENFVVKVKNKGEEFQNPLIIRRCIFGVADKEFNLKVVVGDKFLLNDDSLLHNKFLSKKLNLIINLRSILIPNNAESFKIEALEIESLNNEDSKPNINFSGGDSCNQNLKEITFINLGGIENLKFGTINSNKDKNDVNKYKINFNKVDFIKNCEFKNVTLTGCIGSTHYKKGDNQNLQQYLSSKKIMDIKFANCTFSKFQCLSLFARVEGAHELKFNDSVIYSVDHSGILLSINNSEINRIYCNSIYSESEIQILNNSVIGFKRNEESDLDTESGLFAKCKKLIIKNSKIYNCELTDCNFEIINFDKVFFEKPLKMINSKSVSHNIEFRNLEFKDNLSIEASGSYRSLTKFCQDAGYENGVIFFHKKELETRLNNLLEKFNNNQRLLFKSKNKAVNTFLSILNFIFWLICFTSAILILSETSIIASVCIFTYNQMMDNNSFIGSKLLIILLVILFLIYSFSEYRKKICIYLYELKDSFTETFILGSYKLFSDYGYSLFRPIGSIFVLAVIIYLSILTTHQYSSGATFLAFTLNDQLKLCIKNAIFPFSYALPREFINPKFLETLNPIGKFLSFIHAIFSTAIWAIWFFMIRRRFRIG